MLEGSVDVGPPHPSMLFHVGPGDRVGDALVARDLDEPVEEGRGVVPGHRCLDALLGQAGSDPLEVGGVGPLPADLKDQALREGATIE